MSVATQHRSPRLDPPVAALLARLRRRIRAYLWVDGLAALVVTLGAAFWLSLALDWVVEPPVGLRIILLVAAVLALVWVLARMFGAQLRVPLNDRSMALLLERRFRRFQDALVTSVELADQPDHAAEFNPEMLAHTRRAASEQSAQVDVRAVFNSKPLARRVVAAAALVLATVLFAIFAPDAFGIWARRSLLLSEELWPRTTRLVLEGLEPGGRIKVARGSDWPLEVKADAALGRVIPEIVQVRYSTLDGGRGRENMSREGIVAPGEAAFQIYAHKFKSILSPLTFSILGGDDRLGPFYLDVVESPTIHRMILRCEFPEYMHREPREIPVAGLVQIPRGSKLSVVAEANKPLELVEVDEIQDQEATRLTQLNLAAEQGSAQTRFELPLGELNADRTLAFTLHDNDGIRGRDAVRLAIGALADEPPQVNVQLKGIGAAITPAARLPAAGDITDDYGVARVWFDFHVNDDAPHQQPIPSQGADPAKLEIGDALEVGPLELVPKQKLHWAIQAADECNLGEGANVGSSQRYVLEVVTPEQLRAMLEARELGLRRRFETIIEEFTATRDSLAGLDLAGAKPAAAEPADTAAAADAATGAAARSVAVQFERAVQNSERSAHETLEVAHAFDDMREEMINNRVDTEELKSRLKEGIADPLSQLVEGRFAQLQERFQQLAQLLGKPESAAARTAAIGEMDAILVEMRAVLDKMLELETFNEALDMLRQIIEAQEKVNTETKQKQKQKVRDLVE
ncbi:MAG TPA: hypothetical protein VGJ16_00010 [Pirellulales bacterium]